MNILCIGDSITAGGDDAAKRGGWPGRLAEQLPDDQITNIGVPGYRTIDVIENLLPEAARQQPDLLIIAVGVNDARSTCVPPANPHQPERTEAEYRNDVETLLSQALAISPRLLVVTPMPVNQAAQASQGRWPDELVERYAGILREHCEEKGIPVADLHTDLPKIAQRPFSEYLYDGLHPYPEGYDLMTQAILEAVEPLLLPKLEPSATLEM